MHSLSISAFVLATTVAGRTFINVPVGLDKGTVNDVLSSHGIPGFDPNGRPNADGLYTTNNNNNNNINNVDSRHMLENHIEQDQPMMFHPAPPPVEPFTIAPFIYDEPAPLRPASFPLPPSAAAAPAAHSDSPPPGHPVAVPLAPARELRPGLLVEPPVVARDPSVQSPQALRPNPPIMPPTLPQALPPPPPPSTPVHPAVAAEILPPVNNAPATTTAAAAAAAIKPASTAIVHDNGVLVSTMLVMVTAPRPPVSPLAQPTAAAAVGKAGAAEAAPSENVAAEEDESEDESTSSAAQAAAAPPIIAAPAAVPPPPPQVAATVVGSATIAAAATTTPAATTTTSLSVASSSSNSKRTGPVRLKPLMFAKANVSAFKPEDIDQFTFPSAELSVNMAGLGGGKDNGGSIGSAHAVAAAGFEGSMPSGEHAKPTANNSVNR
ncbi:hypothetical protein GGF42_007928, partial [Coemansia sp. RSA 2424]